MGICRGVPSGVQFSNKGKEMRRPVNWKNLWKEQDLFLIFF